MKRQLHLARTVPDKKYTRIESREFTRDYVLVGSSQRVVSSLVYVINHGGERGRTCVISLNHPRCSSDRRILFDVDKGLLIEQGYRVKAVRLTVLLTHLAN
jgi:hypothetical protein